MGWRDLFRGRASRSRARFSASSSGLEWWIEQASRTDAPITRSQALTVPAVVRGRNLICSISTLPLELVGPGNSVTRSPLLEQFDPDVPNSVHLAQTVEDLLFDGIAWWRITGFGWDGYPVSVRRVDPCSVSLVPPNSSASPAYLPSGEDPRGAAVWIDGVRVDAAEVIRFDSPNPPILTAGGRSIRKAILLDRAAAMHADGQIPSTYFEPSQGSDPSDDDIAQFLADWKAAVKKRATPWKPAFAQLQSLNLPVPKDLQLVELQKQAGLEIANMFGVDPEDLGISTTSRTYQNDVDRRRGRINDVLMPYMLAVSDRLSMGDVTRRGYRCVFDVDDYLRSNPTERWATYGTALDKKVKTVDEVRAEEGLPPLTADQRAELAPPPPPPPVMAEATVEDGTPTPQAISNSRELAVTFDASGKARVWFDKASKRRPVKAKFAGAAQSSVESIQVSMVAANATTGFKVDVGSRIVEGIVLPYNVVGENGMGRFRFAQGALKVPAILSRVKLLRDHDTTEAIGVLQYAEDRPEGMFARFYVGRGAEGDRALTQAEDGVLDGFSVGVTFDRKDVTTGRDGVTDVRNGAWDETSLTAFPAFSDARVARVAASTNSKGDGRMAEETPATETQEGTEPEQSGGVQLSTEAKQKMLASNPALVEQAWKVLTEPAPAPKPAAPALDAATFARLSGTAEGIQLLASVYGVELPKPEPRQVVNPTRPTVQATVREAAPYRFDRTGRLLKGTHEFSADLVAAGTDKAAYDRALEFIKSKFSDDPIGVTDVDELNPTINQNRYVDERAYAYPLWDRLGKGAPPNGVQPFQWPLYSTSGIAVASHTAGTKQDSGDYQTTKQTVTPTAKSARTQIPREVWDMGGTPALSNLIWTKMLRSWGEAREAVIDAALDAAESSPGLTDLATFTAGGGTTGQTLSAEMEAALAGLHFIRGGHRFEFVATQIDLFKALAGAKDGNKRALYPITGPQNANGTSDGRFGTIEIGGVTFVPSWAAASTGTVAAASYLIDPTAVDAWATAPQRLDFATTVEYLEIAIWGYMAAAVVDVPGVMTISYDPVA